MEQTIGIGRTGTILVRMFAVAARAWLFVSQSPSAGITEFPTKTDVGTMAEHLADMYGNSILRLAYSYLHHMEDAEEVLQDTLIQYIRTGPSFDSKAHEKAWCLRVAANLAKNRIKYNRVRRTDELDERLIQEQREDLKYVWEAVKTLPEKYREVIHLFYYEGYSVTEIAGLLGRNEATVRSHLHRGRERLKSVLKEVYDFDGEIQ